MSGFTNSALGECMNTRRWRMGNSKTKVAVDDDWLVLDLGSGHQPHPRADVLADKFLEDNISRSGAEIKIGRGKMICADALRLPFADKTFDFIVASHLAEHMEDPLAFCEEVMRVGKRGYIETPGKFTEKRCPAPYHRWIVSKTPKGLLFETRGEVKTRAGFFWTAYRHVCHFGRPWMQESPLNVKSPALRFPIRCLAYLLRRLPMLVSKDLVFTRLQWEDSFEAERK